MYKYPDRGYGYAPCTYYGVPFIYPSIPIYTVDPYMYPPVNYMQNMQAQTYQPFSRGEIDDYDDYTEEDQVDCEDSSFKGSFGNQRMRTVDISEIKD
ncbi:hypothetical protein ACSVC9_08885 [Clostridium sp. LBM24168]